MDNDHEFFEELDDDSICSIDDELTPSMRLLISGSPFVEPFDRDDVRALRRAWSWTKGAPFHSPPDFDERFELDFGAPHCESSASLAQIAAACGAANIFKWLADQGALSGPGRFDEKERSAIWAQLARSEAQAPVIDAIVEVMAQHGASVNEPFDLEARGNEQESPLAWAAYEHNEALATVLGRRGAKASPSLALRAFMAGCGHPWALAIWTAPSSDINRADLAGKKTLLGLAASALSLGWITRALAAGANPNQPFGIKKQTPLSTAIAEHDGSSEELEWALKDDIDKDKLATSCVQALIAAGAKPSAADVKAASKIHAEGKLALIVRSAAERVLLETETRPRDIVAKPCHRL